MRDLEAGLKTAETQSLLRIHCLGAFCVIRPGEDEVLGAGSKHKAWMLFKYLVAKKGVPVPTQELVDTLWPKRSDPTDTAALRTVVSRLKAMLEPGRAVYQKSPHLICRRDSCAFNIFTPHWLDIEEFEAACVTAHLLGARDRAGAVGLYAEALACYGGDFLADDLYAEWTTIPREYYRRLFLDSTREVCAWLIEAADYVRARVLLERALAVDALVEELHELMLQALMGLGDFRAARDHYRYCSGLFYRELGVSPCDELKRLYRTIKDYFEAQTEKLPAAAGCDKGPLLCGPEVFRHLLSLEGRRLARWGGEASLVWIGMDEAVAAKDAAAMLDDFETASRDLLRRSDVICRADIDRLVLLLPSTGMDGGKIVAENLKQHFIRLFVRGMPGLRMEVAPVESAGHVSPPL